MTFAETRPFLRTEEDNVEFMNNEGLPINSAHFPTPHQTWADVPCQESRPARAGPLLKRARTLAATPTAVENSSDDDFQQTQVQQTQNIID